MTRWGIIGTGDISDRLVPDVQNTPRGQVAAVWGRRDEAAAAFAAAHGISIFTSDRAELLRRDDIDVVYIATPAATHADIALEAIDAGKHVLIEKPIATSAADAERILAAARTAGLFAMEAMWTRFNPLHVEVRERIGDGLLGEVTAVRASFGTPFHPRGRVQTPAQGGSILRDRGIYPVTLAQWYLGAPRAIHAIGEFLDGVDVEGHATMEHEQGVAQLAWSGVRFLDLSATISGERGWVTFAPMFWAGSTAMVHAGSAARIFGEPEVIQHPRNGNGYGPMIAAVAEAIDDGLLEHPWHTHRDTIAVAQTMDAVLAHMSPAASTS
ncbi:Gfo/Idh/MocA family protein [Microbacterium aurantiacum]|uniref:Gfo/Idh/MocA family protein n=1 Tax=Microbacterium aurantiacum TaxID=162393 RepID=UPI003F4981AF